MLIGIINSIINLDFEFLMIDLIMNNLGWVFIFAIAYLWYIEKKSVKGFLLFSGLLLLLGDMFAIFGIPSPPTQFPLIWFPFACIFTFFTQEMKIAKYPAFIIPINLIIVGFLIKIFIIN